jgi:ubiquinone/menaquinone biosynthesis C-methylase UbiE
MKEVYPFQSSDDERKRLIAQGELVAPLTRRLFERAGITAGMRVLDIGSGSGDVAGPTGAVTGIDLDPAQVEYAEQPLRPAASQTFPLWQAIFGKSNSHRL